MWLASIILAAPDIWYTYARNHIVDNGLISRSPEFHLFAKRSHYLVPDLIHGRVTVRSARRLCPALVEFRSQPGDLVAQIGYDRPVLVHLERYVQYVPLDFVRNTVGSVNMVRLS